MEAAVWCRLLKEKHNFHVIYMKKKNEERTDPKMNMETTSTEYLITQEGRSSCYSC